MQLVLHPEPPLHAKGAQSLVPPGRHWPLALQVPAAVRVDDIAGHEGGVQTVPTG